MRIRFLNEVFALRLPEDMKLEEIGFYTLCDERAKNANETSPMWRCEMILTSACNFKCPYCRPLRQDCQGTMPLERALFAKAGR